MQQEARDRWSISDAASRRHGDNLPQRMLVVLVRPAGCARRRRAVLLVVARRRAAMVVPVVRGGWANAALLAPAGCYRRRHAACVASCGDSRARLPRRSAAPPPSLCCPLFTTAPATSSCMLLPQLRTTFASVNSRSPSPPVLERIRRRHKLRKDAVFLGTAEDAGGRRWLIFRGTDEEKRFAAFLPQAARHQAKHCVRGLKTPTCAPNQAPPPASPQACAACESIQQSRKAMLSATRGRLLKTEASGGLTTPYEGPTPTASGTPARAHAAGPRVSFLTRRTTRA